MTVVLPSSTKTGLPAAGTAGSLSRVSDDAEGVWMDTGSQWFALNKHVLNVQEFGAKGDGSTDDTSAISAAISAGEANTTTGRVLYFPPGDYKVTSTLQITLRGWRFIGAHDGRPSLLASSRIKYTGTGTCIQVGTDNGHAYDAADYDGVQGFGLENIAADYAGTLTSPANGLGTGYGSGTKFVQDWRGGHQRWRNVVVEHLKMRSGASRATSTTSATSS